MKEYIDNKNGIITRYKFSPTEILPKNIPISTPITFAFIGQDLVLTKKNNGWWDVLGGKIKKNETWIDALKRESIEEAGVSIDNIVVVGYILAENSGNLKNLAFPKRNILPVTLSFVKKVNNHWRRHETLKRDIFKRKEAKNILIKRNDNGQLAEIFDYVISYYENQKYSYVFDYIEGDKYFKDLPNTQSMVFLRHGYNSFFIVRDFNEESFSLPGGGCNLNEDGRTCAIRETQEEAQIKVLNIKLIGNVLVKVCKNNKTLSESTHQRYLADAINMEEFVPRKNDSEIIERKIIHIDSLQKEVQMLDNETGSKILLSLKKLL